MARKKNWSLLVKPTHACNLKCKYCYDKPTRQMYGDSKMSYETTEYIANLVEKYTENCTWIWHGGEPAMMGIDYYKNVQKIFYKHYKTNFKQNMQSNGTLLTQEWVDLSRDYSIDIGVSFDVFSQDVRGKGTRDLVESNIRRFIEQGVGIGVISVVNTENCDKQIEMYEYLKQELNIGGSFNHIYRTDGSLLNSLEPDEEKYAREFRKFFDYWIRDFSANAKSERSAMEGLSETILGCGNTCATSDCRKNWISVNCIGKVYPCDRHVPEKYAMGCIEDYNSIDEVYLNSNYRRYYNDIQRRFLTHCSDSNCGYFRYCNGLCNANHIAVTGSGEGVDPSSCLSFKYRFIEAYDSLRTLDFYKTKINPVALREILSKNFLSLTEIKEYLSGKGLFVDWQYSKEPSKFLHSTEYKIFRIFNPEQNSTSGHIDICNPFDISKINPLTFDMASIKPQRNQMLEYRFNKNIRKILDLVYNNQTATTL